MTDKFKKFDSVIILPYKDDKFNREGTIMGIDPVRGFYVSNLNMPYSGVICNWFQANQLKKIGKRK